jgi:hypothetical protein
MAKGIWDKNEALADARDAATLYDDASVDYDSITVYYDGYDPTGLTAEGETNATWARVTE